MFLGAPDVKVWPSELRCTSCEHSSSSHVALCGCQPAKCSMEAVVSGPVASPRSPAFDPVWAAQCADTAPTPSPISLMLAACFEIKVLSLIFVVIVFFLSLLWFYLFLASGMIKKSTMDLLVFQVSYIYALVVFEDYLYATHTDPSKGSSTVELLQIHRFNITAESRTLASLGNTRRLRVFHKLTQPKGKGHFIYRLTCASMCQNLSCLVTLKLESVLVQKEDALLGYNDLPVISDFIHSQESCM